MRFQHFKHSSISFTLWIFLHFDLWITMTLVVFLRIWSTYIQSSTPSNERFGVLTCPSRGLIAFSSRKSFTTRFGSMELYGLGVIQQTQRILCVLIVSQYLQWKSMILSIISFICKLCKTMYIPPQSRKLYKEFLWITINKYFRIAESYEVEVLCNREQNSLVEYSSSTICQGGVPNLFVC